MSRGYTKTYNRKSNLQANIQFDTLFNENSNRPSAVRSAGTVGKWGITSFTSIRNANGLGLHRDEPIPPTTSQNKRQKLENDQNNKVTTNSDPFSFDNSLNVPVIKPKKFFKSRNTDATDSSTPKETSSVYSSKNDFGYTATTKKTKSKPPTPALPPPQKITTPKTSPRTSVNSNRSQNSTRQSNNSAKSALREIVAKVLSPPPVSKSTSNISTRSRITRSNTAASTTIEAKIVTVPALSPPISVAPIVNRPVRDESKPPIVLRISKGKSRLLSDSDESTQELTPSPTIVKIGLASPTNSAKSERSEKSECSNSKSPAQHNSEARKGGRVTRSSRRNQHISDPESAGLSDSNDPFPSLFMSPRKSVDGEPQYIPAEEYELERKAIYENLLGGSPTYSIPIVTPRREEDPVSITLPVIDNNNKQLIDQNLEEPQKTDQEIKNQKSPVPDEPEPMEEDQDDQEPPPPNEIEASSASQPTNELSSTKIEERPQRILLNIPKKNIINNNNQDSSSGEEDTPSENMDDNSDETNLTSKQEEEKMDEEKPPDDEPPDDQLDKPDEHEEEQEQQPPPVKLVISKKKGSIFKSRSLVPGSSNKRYLYKHKWSDSDKELQKGANATSGQANTGKTPADTSVFDVDEVDFEATKLTRVTHWPGEDADPMDEAEAITSIKCTKKAKGFYTVVRNVKKAHQIQEIGEFQEFNDDVDYILDALQDNNPISTRCLSAITLATKCMTPAFRMHVKSHGTVAKFFKALHDAAKDQSLGLCTATVMFVLSQDRLNMDLDRDCLELMLNLLESDASHENALDDCGLSSVQLEKNKQKVRELCTDIQSQGHALHLNLNNITVGHLAMETLLSLTSKRAGEWFKEELRELGGLEHIVKTICECCRQVSDYVVSWTDTLLDKLRKVDRCMRVLENVTLVNEENQNYILKYNDGAAIDTLVKLYRLCDAEIPLYPVTDIADKESTGAVIRETLLVTLKVLINLTHHFNANSMGSAVIGSRQGIVDACLHLLLQVPNYIPEQKKFELSVLVLMLLINLIQHCDDNKKRLLEAKAPADFESIFPCDKTAIKALIEQFNAREQLARLAELRTNAILDGEKDTEVPVKQPKSQEEFIEETMHKLLQKAGTHMEHTMIASYIVLLVGYVIMDNAEYEERVRSAIPANNFSAMHDLLVKFFQFMKMTASGEAVSVCHIKATEKVIKYLDKCDKEMEKKLKQIEEQSCYIPDDTTNSIGNLNITSESDRHTDTSEIDLDMSLS